MPEAVLSAAGTAGQELPESMIDLPAVADGDHDDDKLFASYSVNDPIV
jgi:hypothetical protein